MLAHGRPGLSSRWLLTVALVVLAWACVDAPSSLATQPDLDLSVDQNIRLGTTERYAVPAGDVNGDGHPDVLMPEEGSDYKGRAGAGMAYVLYGSASLGTMSVGEAVAAGKGFSVGGGQPDDHLATDAQPAGDVNGDQYDDIILVSHAPGATGPSNAVIVYGRPTSGDIDLRSPPAGRTTTLTGISDFEFARGTGDVNGDGHDDVLVSSIFDPMPHGSLAGLAFVVFGSSSPPTSIDISSMGAGTGFRIDGGASADLASFIGGAGDGRGGDVNNDGFDDILIGATNTDPHDRSGAGTAYVLLGGHALGDVDLGSLPPGRGYRIDGDQAQDNLGGWLRFADANGDGFDDVIVSALTDGGSGAVYVVYGAATPADVDLHSLGIRGGFRVDNAHLGESGGDLNGDGRDDILIGTDSGVLALYAPPATFSVDPASVSSSAGFWIRGASMGLAIGDVTLDGHPDLLLNGTGAVVVTGDGDGDGRRDDVDNCRSVTNPSQTDTDHDGIGDDCDPDVDGDGADDASDDCPGLYNPGQTDSDHDGIGDACDSDIDGDGVANSADNCVSTSNPTQNDVDHDGAGDSCDPDIDADGLTNVADDCPSIVNPDQLDQDRDGIGDVCDPDADGDGSPNATDGCPSVVNPDQLDHDRDGIGDVCDPDIDGDGTANAADNCPVPNPDQADRDHDGAGDACDVDLDGDGAPNSTDDCPSASNAGQADQDHDGTGDACDSDFPDASAPVGQIRGPEAVAVNDPLDLTVDALDRGSGWDASATTWDVDGQAPQRGAKAHFVFRHTGPVTITVQLADHAGNVARKTTRVSVWDASWTPSPEKAAPHRLKFEPIVLEGAPAGALVQLRCVGPNCPCRSSTTRIRKGDEGVEIGTSLRNRLFDFGSAVTMRVTYPNGTGGKEWTWHVTDAFPTLTVAAGTRLLAPGAQWTPGTPQTKPFSLSAGTVAKPGQRVLHSIGPFKVSGAPRGSRVTITCLSACRTNGHVLRILEPHTLVAKGMGRSWLVHSTAPTRVVTLEVTVVAPGMTGRTIRFRVSTAGVRSVKSC